MAFVLCLCTGCGVWSSAPALDDDDTWQLSSHEAACLVAELLAAQFSAVNPDRHHPRAWAMDLGDGDYRVLYVRGEQGLFLPEGNGAFERDTFLGPEEQAFLADPPASPLGRIWFRHLSAVSPWAGGSESLLVEIRALGDRACAVRIESRSPDQEPRAERIRQIGYVLDAAEKMKLGLAHYRAGDDKNALRVFAWLCQLHDEGLGPVHDRLLAQAHALSGLILQRWGRGEDARRELALARMRAPDSRELALAWGRLMEDLGRPGDALATMQRAAASCSPGSSESLLMTRLAEDKKREARAASSYTSCLAKAEALIGERRYWAAKNWAERARDLRPRGVRAQRVLARTLDRLGRDREARDLRLLSLQGRRADAELLLGLAANERKLGHPELALRWILRNPTLLQDNEHASQVATALIEELGPEESLRMMRSEGRHDSTLPLILAWIRKQPGPRAELFASILAGESVDRERAAAGRALLGAEPLPERDLPGASGLLEQPPTELGAPGK